MSAADIQFEFPAPETQRAPTAQARATSAAANIRTGDALSPGMGPASEGLEEGGFFCSCAMTPTIALRTHIATARCQAGPQGSKRSTLIRAKIAWAWAVIRPGASPKVRSPTGAPRN